jgi:hypothetical protein
MLHGPVLGLTVQTSPRLETPQHRSRPEKHGQTPKTEAHEARDGGATRNLPSVIGRKFHEEEPVDLAGRGSSEWFCCEHIANFGQVLEIWKASRIDADKKDRQSFLPLPRSVLAKICHDFPYRQTASSHDSLTLLPAQVKQSVLVINHRVRNVSCLLQALLP